MLLVAEPTYAGGDHASTNAGLLAALRLACPHEPILLAATLRQQAAMEEVQPLPPGVAVAAIDVAPAGEVSLARFHGQWRALSRLVSRSGANDLVLLSAGPETLFAMRLLAIRHHRLRLYAVLHGNVARLHGWRSRDPRRRWVDLESALRVARHPRVALVLLEPYIRDRVIETPPFRGHRLLVWPNGLMPAEFAARPDPPVSLPERLTVGFVGSATRAKGFQTFLDIARAADPSRTAFAVAGHALDAAFDLSRGPTIDLPATALSRTEFLARVRALDWVVLPFDPELYAFTASGSLLDALAQLRPLVALDMPAVRQLEAEVGPVGIVCRSREEMVALFAGDDPRLRDAAAYALYQANLDRARSRRLPDRLARTIARDLEAVSSSGYSRAGSSRRRRRRAGRP